MNPAVPVDPCAYPRGMQCDRTRCGARLAGRPGQVGTLEADKSCDLAISGIERPAEPVSLIGFTPLHARIWKGR